MKHAGFWRQLLSASIDQFIIILPSTLIPETYFYFVVGSGVDPLVARFYTNFMVVGFAAAFFSFYYIFFNGRYGVTLGRYLLRLKLIRFDQPNRDGIGVARAAVRFLLFVTVGAFSGVIGFLGLPMITGVIIEAAAGITILWLLIDGRRRTLEDKIMGTVMVYDPTGKFAAFDPDKLPFAKIRPYSFTVFVTINVLASVYSALNL